MGLFYEFIFEDDFVYEDGARVWATGDEMGYSLHGEFACRILSSFVLYCLVEFGEMSRRADSRRLHEWLAGGILLFHLLIWRKLRGRLRTLLVPRVRSVFEHQRQRLWSTGSDRG